MTDMNRVDDEPILSDLKQAWTDYGWVYPGYKRRNQMERLPWYWKLRESLGLASGKLPDEEHTMHVSTVNGVTITVLSREEARKRFPKSTRPHRVLARCPACLKEVSAGRYNQHIKIHNSD